MSVTREVRIEALLGRKLLGPDGHHVGRIEEIRARRQGSGWVSTEIIIGTLGLLERLGVGANMLMGRTSGGCIVKWEQIDLSDPEKPRLLVPVDDLEHIGDQDADGDSVR
jgi:sporulation protein YlmC with PRC-barrel domain